MSVLVWGQELGPQVNKFEQVSSDNHQMSVAVGGSPRLMSKRERSPGLRGRGVPYIAIPGGCDVPTIPPRTK